jgi:hypothetical protein
MNNSYVAKVHLCFYIACGPAMILTVTNQPTYISIDQRFSNFPQSRITSQAVGAHADHLRKIPHA